MSKTRFPAPDSAESGPLICVHLVTFRERIAASHPSRLGTTTPRLVADGLPA